MLRESPGESRHTGGCRTVRQYACEDFLGSTHDARTAYHCLFWSHYPPEAMLNSTLLSVYRDTILLSSTGAPPALTFRRPRFGRPAPVAQSVDSGSTSMWKVYAVFTKLNRTNTAAHMIMAARRQWEDDRAPATAVCFVSDRQALDEQNWEQVHSTST